MRYPDLPQALVLGGGYFELTEASRTWVRSILGDEQSPDVDFEQFERENAGFAAMLQELHGADGWKRLLKHLMLDFLRRHSDSAGRTAPC